MEHKKSGFDAPVYGEVIPKGTTFKRNPNGTYTLVPPKKKDDGKDKPKKTLKKK